MQSYQKVVKYFSYLKKEYNINICIKDFCGFIPINKELERMLNPYLYHSNDYCMYMKHDKKDYFNCLSMIPKMLKKCIKLKAPFYGVCQGCVAEYVVPIVNDNNVLGAINIGSFPIDSGQREKRLHEICASSNSLDYEALNILYEKNITGVCDNIDTILQTMEIIADFLASSYEIFSATHNTLDLTKECTETVSFVAQVIEYIHNNYNKKITVEDISEFCHYSASYVGRNFKKKLGVTINTYINKMRVEISKTHLINSTLTISEISETVGFVDPNYFSKVFTDLIGITPAEFRRRFF